MNIDDIIKTINDSKYDDTKIAHGVDTVTPEQKRCDVSPDVVRDLATYIGGLEPAELMKVILRLTTEVEKRRLFFVNTALRAHAPFEEAMARLHTWRAENAAK